MNIELQAKKYGVCDLKYAQKLLNLGVKQESLWFWFEQGNKVHEGYENKKPEYIWVLQPYFKGMNKYCTCSAFTVAELGEMLPATIGDETWLAYFKSLNGYGGICEKIGYFKWENMPNKSVLHKSIHTISEACQDPIDKIRYFSEANARAKMLIWLIENKHLNPKEL